MKLGVADKRIKLLLTTPSGLAVKGLQPAVVTTIRFRIALLGTESSLKDVADAHPEWRVHRWKGSKLRWSIDVTGNTRLLFDYDPKKKEITDMIYDDPH